MPLRGPILPGRSTVAVTVPSAGRASTTRSRGVPSPITISERPIVTVSASPGQAVGTAPSTPSSPAAKTIRSPRATSRSGACAEAHLGPGEVHHENQRPARPLRRGAEAGGPQGPLPGPVVGAVDAPAVHPRRDERVEAAGGVGGRPQRREDLGAADHRRGTVAHPAARAPRPP